MGRKSLSRQLLGWFVTGVYRICFEYFLPLILNILLFVFKIIGKVIDLFPQRWWLGSLGFIGSVIWIHQNQSYEPSDLAFRASLGLFTFSFAYSFNYFLKRFESRRSGQYHSQANDWYHDPIAEKFYRSKGWKNLRYRFLKTAEKKCVLCGSVRGPFHVDHIKPRSKYPRLALDIDNLQLLCEPCNLGKGADDVGNTDFRKKRSRLFG